MRTTDQVKEGGRPGNVSELEAPGAGLIGGGGWGALRVGDGGG